MRTVPQKAILSPGPGLGHMQKHRLLAVGFSLAFALTGGFFGFFAPVERALYDLRQGLQPLGETESNVALVAIDDDSLQKLGRWPWPRSRIAALVRRLSEQDAKVIAIDLLLSEASPYDESLSEAIRAAGEVIAPYHVAGFEYAQGDPPATGSMLVPVPPIRSSVGLAYGDIAVDADGVVRRVPVSYGDPGGPGHWSLSVEAVRRFLSIPLDKVAGDGNRLQLGPLTAPLSDQSLFLNFIRPHDAPIPWPLRDTFSASDVLSRDLGERIAGKLVFLGVTATGVGDRYTSPLKDLGPIPGVVFHLTAAQNILSGTSVRVAKAQWVAFPLLLCAAVQSVAIQGGKVWRFLIATLFVGGVYSLVSLFFAANYYLWLPAAPVLLFLALNFLLQGLISFSEEKRHRLAVMAALSRYFAPAVVPAIIRRDRNPFGTGIIDGAILFADLAGFTSRSENAPPEDVVELLNRHFAIMEEAVFQHGGALDKFTGDGVMAIFGLLPGDSPPVDAAIAAAWQIRKTLESRISEAEAEPGRWLNASFGIDSGLFIVGDIGTERRADYTAIGDVVNTAARLEENAAPGEILVTDRAVEQSLLWEFAQCAETSLKGKKRAVRVHRVAGPKEDSL